MKTPSKGMIIETKFQGNIPIILYVMAPEQGIQKVEQYKPTPSPPILTFV